MISYKQKFKLVFYYLLDRLGEPSTWQGIGFLCTVLTGRYIDLEWGQIAVLGGIVSATLKIFLKG
ncbi:MAG: hypothetical protein A3F67_10925 [Verrucomicrobia bacterium RIFCSPHIGHO2_12_FULL_41_10]|nr:MAG: hypothetical protein A3F67_10925 [Verrucomicrobia bacterium RIFCSPHIGHO2_12_FULL_41_10]